MTEDKPVKKRDPIYVTIIILLLGAGAFCAYQWNYYLDKSEKCAREVAGMDDYFKQMESDLGSAGLDLQSDELRTNLLNMLAEMDTLQTDNQEMLDSITAQRTRVSGLLAELDDMKAKGKRDARTIFKLTRETETLRKVMRMQVHKIDSLHRLNVVYEGVIEGHEQTIKENEGHISDLTSEKDKLADKVEVGRKLSTSGLKADALRVRSSGNYKETPRAKSTNMIRACFTVMANELANAGDKAFYMRIISPSGSVLQDGGPVYFDAAGSQMEASIKRVVKYNKDNMDLCIYYDVESEVDAGEYIVKIFCEGKEIGSTNFALK